MVKQKKNKSYLLKRVSGGDVTVNGDFNTTGSLNIVDSSNTTKETAVNTVTNTTIDIYKKKKCFLGICW